ncbi:MAG TPA: glycosyltransferase family 4 protein, partial [Candidatus Saccharimonadales bacterium]|nr:glycosyltransferase family 4 protein [Candidatus Saccharimonadales bacterium]
TYFGPNGTRLKKLKNLEVYTNNLRPLVHNYEEFRDLTESPELMNHYYPSMWDFYYAQKMFERARAGEFDLLHFHHPETAMPFVKMYPEVPVVYTLHDPVYNWYKETFEMYNTPNQYYISISDNQRRTAPDLNYVATVYNGIDPEMFAFSEEEHDDYLLFAGRIVPEKGVKEAIQVAMEADMRLLIIGPLYPDHQEYFDQHIKPFLNEKILYLGFIGRQELVRYYQKAKALILPAQWEEPFGLTTIEAMACGTPVIALRRGAFPEIIEDGQNGYVVDSLADMLDAIKKIHLISSKACRDHVVENFSIKQMVDGYEKAYREVVKRAARGRYGLRPLHHIKRISRTAKQSGKKLIGNAKK